MRWKLWTSLSVVGMTLGSVFPQDSDVQKVDMSSTSVKQQVLSLDFKNNGQHVAANVGQRIEITLGSYGMNPYGAPQVSYPAIRLDSVAQVERANPFSGAPNIYMFEAVGEGEVQVKFPLITEDPDLAKRLSFTVMIHVRAGAGKPTALQASMTPDQANTLRWTNAWINVHSLLLQTFTPSLPTLTGIEVELVAADPGAASAEVSMAVMRRTSDRSEDVLAEISKTVPVADCAHVLFLLPKGGVRVSPGQLYSISLSSVASVFGWKYVGGGYASGAASFQGFHGQPLSPDTRSTFLFRTFGAN
jgi:hypothetical protein